MGSTGQADNSRKQAYCNHEGCQVPVDRLGDNCPECKAKREHYSKMYDQTHYISTLDKFPKDVHFAALIAETRAELDSYDHNRTTTTPTLQYVWFESEEALNWFIVEDAKKKYGPSKTYQVIRVTPVKVNITPTITYS